MDGLKAVPFEVPPRDDCKPDILWTVNLFDLPLPNVPQLLFSTDAGGPVLPKYQVRDSLICGGYRGDQTIIGKQRVALHSAALRCDGLLDGTEQAPHRRRNLRSCE